MQATVIDHHSDVAVLRLRGELDADTATQLHAALAERLEAFAALLDLSGSGRELVIESRALRPQIGSSPAA